MTKSRQPGLGSPKRRCEYCDRPMGGALRYFLVGTMDAEIRGPYHAGCAETVVSASHRDHERLTQIIQPYDHFTTIREETLPW